MWLDARYTFRTDDGHLIYVKSKGVFFPQSEDFIRHENMSQSEVDWLTRLQFEADGAGPYNWMNGIFAVGVLAMHKRKIIIDAYRMTNFPGKPPKDLHV
jgi:hypothetical protein